MKKRLYDEVTNELVKLDRHCNWNYMFDDNDYLARDLFNDDDPKWEGVAEDLEEILDAMEDEYYYLYNAIPKLKTLIEALREE